MALTAFNLPDPMSIAKYALPIPGGAGADSAAQAKALQPPGALQVSAAHILLQLMPDAFDPPSAAGTNSDTPHTPA